MKIIKRKFLNVTDENPADILKSGRKPGDRYVLLEDSFEEIFNREYKEMHPVEIADRCHKIIGLLQCLQFTVNTKDFNQYVGSPHDYLFGTIREELEDILSTIGHTSSFTSDDEDEEDED